MKPIGTPATCRAWLAVLLGAAATLCAAATDDAAERERIASERRAAEARFAAEDRDCRARFVVTACIDEARERQRAVLAALRDRELALDDAERRQRAAERLQAIDRKQAEAAAPAGSAPAVQPVTRPPARPASATVGVDDKGAAASAASDAVRARAPDPVAAREAARRASAAQSRQLEGDAERARIAAREAERTARGKPAVALPLPPELAASAPAR